MKKLLRPGDVLLLGLAGAMDVFEDVKGAFGVMARGSDMLYGWVPERYRKHNFSRVAARQLITGDIEKVVKGDQAYLRLTSAGREKIARDFPMFSFSQKTWDKKWRVVIFDISELDRRVRDGLRIKLRELGFGMLQESVWITPHDVGADLREVLEQYDLGDVAYVLEVGEVLAGDIPALVRKIWHLDSLEDEYNDIINDVTKLKHMYVGTHDRVSQHTSTQEEKEQKRGRKKAVENREVEKNEVEKKVREIRQRYVAAVLSDPCLPHELLPKDWPGKKVKAAVEGLGKFLGNST